MLDFLNKTSWKTTITGVISAVGLVATLFPQTQIAGIAIAAGAHAVQGLVSRDNDKTSEQVNDKLP